MKEITEKNERLLNLRKVQGWTQKQAALKLEIPIAVYQRIEEGKKSGKIENWDRVQKLYNIPDEEMWKVVKGKNKEEE